MEVGEVKIGDLVWYNAEVACKIQEVYQDGVALRSLKIKVPYNDIDPIPLTKEILEKNGWELIEGEYTKDCKVCERLYLIQNHFSFSTFDSWTVIVGASYIGTIHYLHELQHILWVLGEDDNLSN